ncbi:MAG: Stk1 family PASTA domain-containing Ser/Thr kinase [Bacillota bacterium]
MELIGRVIAGRYHVEELLGGGGMAVVYRAHCRYLQRDVTIKILRPQYSDDADFVERFRREAQAVARLSHPNIVNVFDVGQDGIIHYIVMEYIDGITLKRYIREKGPLAPVEAVDIARQICAALVHAHASGIVHRDIKSGNILIAKDGRVKVTDFGIARSTTDVTVTQTGTIVGSVHYISPEQARGEPASFQSDLYSVGVVLFEMLAGRLPYEGESPIAVAMKHMGDQPPSLSKLNPAVSPELEMVVRRAMAKDRARRYASAEEMLEDLKTVLIGQISEQTKKLMLDENPTMVLPREELKQVLGKQQAAREKKNKRKLWGGLAILVTLLILGGAGFFLLLPKTVEVPDLTNLTVEEAEQRLKPAHLQLEVLGREYSDTIAENRIISQREKPGTEVREGQTIGVIVSVGVEKVDVPDLSGQDKEDARLALEKAGLALGTIDYQYSDEYEKDTVISQNPAAGEQVPRQTAVNLVVSKGKKPVLLKMPNVTGLSLTAARAALEAMGLKVPEENITQEASTDFFPGTVISQEPQPGTETEKGSSVKLKVSAGPGPQPQQISISVNIPGAGEPHQVSIKVVDNKSPEGRQEFIGSGTGGSTLVVPIRYYGKAKALIFIDGQKSEEQELTP